MNTQKTDQIISELNLEHGIPNDANNSIETDGLKMSFGETQHVEVFSLKDDLDESNEQEDH